MGFLSVGIYGSLHIDAAMDPVDFLPTDTYLTKFIHVIDEEHPEFGYLANIIINKITYTVEDFESIDKESKKLLQTPL
jgi:hypothetical protein